MQRGVFRGIAEVLCGRTSGQGESPRDRNQVWWTKEGAKAVGENKEVWKRIGKINDRGRQSHVGVPTLVYGQKKKVVRRAVEKVRNDMEEEVDNNLEEDCGRKSIYKLACDRT